jgi:shikimate dehydrogenase
MSDRYAIIGNPVAHSKSPEIHAAFARATRQDIEYTRLESPLDAFAQTVERFRAGGGKGANVTLPFKHEAFGLCEQVSERARVAQAVNTMRFEDAFGDNTDGIGLVRDLGDHMQFVLKGKHVAILGAGALLEAGVARLVIANRTVAKATALAERFSGTTACGYDALAGERFDLIVNATSAGLAGETPPVPPHVMKGARLAYDMVYGRDTPFLAAARHAGVRASDGLGMLVEQAAESFFVWRGVRPATRPVLEKLRGA